jgi:hypothetical protein
MSKLSPNDKCICGSGTKFKKCCGPRGGLNEIDHAEVQAYREQSDRDYASRPRSRTRPSLVHFAHMYSYKA